MPTFTRAGHGKEKQRTAKSPSCFAQPTCQLPQALTVTNRAAKHVPSSTTKPAAQCSTIPGRWLLGFGACRAKAAARQTLGRKASEAATSVQPVKTRESSEHTGARTMVARFQEGFQFSNFEPAQRLLHTAARPPASHKKEKQKKPRCGISMMRQRLFAPGGDAAADIPLAV